MKEYVCTLPEEVQRKAQDELHEVPERRAQDIQHIRDWIQKQPHLNARTDDWSILKFLRGCKFSLERTKEKTDVFYSCRSACPEWFLGRDPQNKKLRILIENLGFLPLPGYDDEGRKVILVKVGALDPREFDFDDAQKVALMLFDLLMEEDEQFSVGGMVEVVDCRGFTAAHFMSMKPLAMKKMMTIFQEGYPVRPKAFHYLYVSTIFESLFQMWKPLMKEKLKKRLHMHGSNLESFYEHVPKRMLPVEYGGENGTIQDIIDYWASRMDARRDWFLEEDSYGVDESKRPGKPKSTVDLFGVEGSFRKLNID